MSTRILYGIIICILVALGFAFINNYRGNFQNYRALAKSIREKDAPGELVLRKIVSSYSKDGDVTINSTKIHEELAKSKMDNHLIGIWHNGVGIYFNDINKCIPNIYRRVAEFENVKISVGEINNINYVRCEKNVIIHLKNEDSIFSFVWINDENSNQNRLK